MLCYKNYCWLNPQVSQRRARPLFLLARATTALLWKVRKNVGPEVKWKEGPAFLTSSRYQSPSLPFLIQSRPIFVSILFAINLIKLITRILQYYLSILFLICVSCFPIRTLVLAKSFWPIKISLKNYKLWLGYRNYVHWFNK